MTKKEIKHIAERREKDDWMCEKINKILDGINFGSSNLPCAIGQIESVMALAGRRKE